MRPVSRELAQLRLDAEGAARVDDWAALMTLADRLRAEDPAWWPHAWAPLVAVAARATGGDAAAYLREAVAGGFRQPDLLPLDSLHDLDGWAELAGAMRAPVLPPAIEVTAWPGTSYGPPLVLDQLPPDRAALLRERAPAAEATAWATARRVLAWASAYWEHAEDHVDGGDAVEVLERADAGERFACVEYSILLSQTLNALGIPARRVQVLMHDYHVGFGRGHVVSEAWVDDLGGWVVLEGQNGAWWGTEDQPLGLRDLQALHHAGGPRLDMCTTLREVSAEEQDLWWSYFDTAIASGLAWTESLVPLFQGEPAPARLVVPPTEITHPDLASIETGVVDAGDGPGLVFRPTHPYATGTAVGERELGPGEPLALETLPPGEHELEVCTVTAYGRLAAQRLAVVRR